MTESIINDKRLFHACMLYEMLQGRPIFQSFLHFSASLRAPNLDFREFEFWFYRFQRGLTDFDYDSSADLENKPLLTDLPMDVANRVLDSLSYKTLLVLRKVSKSLRQLVDQRPPPYKSITVIIEEYGAMISFDEQHDVRYGTVVHRDLMTTHLSTSVRYKFQQKSHEFPDSDAIRFACDDLKTILIHPKLQLDSLKIRVALDAHSYFEKEKDVEKRKKYFGYLQEMLSTIGRPTLDVKKLEIWVKNHGELSSILPFMTPGYLESINIQSSNIAKSRLPMSEIVKLSQWKQAKRLHIDRFIVQFHIGNLFHFETCWIRFANFSMKSLTELRNALVLRPKFVSLVLESSKAMDIDSIDDYLGEDIPQDPPTPNYRYYPLADTVDSVLEINLTPKSLNLKRTSKQELIR